MSSQKHISFRSLKTWIALVTYHPQPLCSPTCHCSASIWEVWFVSGGIWDYFKMMLAPLFGALLLNIKEACTGVLKKKEHFGVNCYIQRIR